ncbi:MAG: hypothetical protein Q4B60_06980 [Erysipelotrichaceae bacterium]|nr:hypothetical protein [Erysipelotrichaceae bacterium]
MTIRKIKIIDDDGLREKLDSIYENSSHIKIAKWSLLLAEHIIEIAGINKNDYPPISEGFHINKLWQLGEMRMHDVRQAGFKIHQIARVQEDEIKKTAFRVIGQAIASGHMKEHGMVASDYAIKVINLMYPKNMDRVIEERKWQISELEKL